MSKEFIDENKPVDGYIEVRKLLEQHDKIRSYRLEQHDNPSFEWGNTIEIKYSVKSIITIESYFEECYESSNIAFPSNSTEKYMIKSLNKAIEETYELANSESRFNKFIKEDICPDSISLEIENTINETTSKKFIDLFYLLIKKYNKVKKNVSVCKEMIPYYDKVFSRKKPAIKEGLYKASA